MWKDSLCQWGFHHCLYRYHSLQCSSSFCVVDLKFKFGGIPFVAQQKEIQLVPMRMQVQSLASLSGWLSSGVALSCGVGHRHGSDLALPWLWCRSAVTAPIWPLAWELPYAAGVALKREKKKNLILLIYSLVKLSINACCNATALLCIALNLLFFFFWFLCIKSWYIQHWLLFFLFLNFYSENFQALRKYFENNYNTLQLDWTSFHILLYFHIYTYMHVCIHT